MAIEKLRFVSLLLVLAEAGCAGSREDVLSAHDAGKGEARTFRVTLGQAWNAARAALLWNDADGVEEHPTARFLYAEAGTNLTGWGQAMGVWIDPLNTRTTRISVVVSRRVSTNVAAPNDSSLLDDIERALLREIRGEPAPNEDPD